MLHECSQCALSAAARHVESIVSECDAGVCAAVMVLPLIEVRAHAIHRVLNIAVHMRSSAVLLHAELSCGAGIRFSLSCAHDQVWPL